MTANFNKDNLKEGMTVYLLYTGYDLSVGKYAPRKKIFHHRRNYF